MRYGFIGCGNMGGAVARAVCRGAGAGQVVLANRTAAKAEALAKELGCTAAGNEAAADCDFVFLGVKPQMMAGVLAELPPGWPPGPIPLCWSRWRPGFRCSGCGRWPAESTRSSG